MTWKLAVKDSGYGYYALQTEAIGPVPVRLFLTANLLDQLEESIYPQIVNAATFPGVKLVAITPDVHHGYGVPIGTALLTDAQSGAVALGPVGYDIGCFTGGTRVSTLDGPRSLRDLADTGGEHWILSLTSEHRVVAAKATAKLTRRRAALVRVTLDNGATIDCTPDHQFMLRDGSWHAGAPRRSLRYVTTRLLWDAQRRNRPLFLSATRFRTVAGSASFPRPAPGRQSTGS